MCSPRVLFLDADCADRSRRSESGLRPGVLRPEWLAVALTVFAGGCIYPCGSGVCNSRESLFNLPATRYGGSEKLIGNQSCSPRFLDRDCKAKAYPTFNKFLPWCDDWSTTATAKRCANGILLRQQWDLKKLMPADYKGGFRQAFMDVAHGSDGELPAVPPPVYWNAHFRSDSGQRRAECWFSGYRAGAALAAVRLAPLKRIAASYDWTVPDSPAPFAGGELISRGSLQQFAPGTGQYPQSGPQPMMNPPMMNPPMMNPPMMNPPMMNPQLPHAVNAAPNAGSSLLPGFSGSGMPPAGGWSGGQRQLPRGGLVY